MSSNIFQFSPLLMIFRAEAGEVTEVVTRLLIQLAVILFAAKLAGKIATRYLKLPPVLAELGAGELLFQALAPYFLSQKWMVCRQ